MRKALLLSLATTTLALTTAARADAFFNDNLKGVPVCFAQSTVSASDDAKRLSPTIEAAVYAAALQQLRTAGVPFTTTCKNSRYDLQVYIDAMDGPKDAGITIFTFSLDVFDFDSAEVGAIIYQDSAYGFTSRTGADFGAHIATNVANKVKVFAQAYRTLNR